MKYTLERCIARKDVLNFIPYKDFDEEVRLNEPPRKRLVFSMRTPDIYYDSNKFHWSVLVEVRHRREWISWECHLDLWEFFFEEKNKKKNKSESFSKNGGCLYRTALVRHAYLLPSFFPLVAVFHDCCSEVEKNRNANIAKAIFHALVK